MLALCSAQIHFLCLWGEVISDLQTRMTPVSVAKMIMILGKKHPDSRNTKETPRLQELGGKVHANLCLPSCVMSQEPNRKFRNKKLAQMNIYIYKTLGGFCQVDFLIRFLSRAGCSTCQRRRILVTKIHANLVVQMCSLFFWQKWRISVFALFAKKCRC